MANFFDRMLGRSNKNSSSKQAKDRLKFVLLHDRINIPPERMEELKAEILAVISKYVEVETDSVDIALEPRDRRSSQIVAQIPFSKEGGNDEDDATDDDKPKADDAAS